MNLQLITKCSKLCICSRRHGEPWSRFRSKVSKALIAPEAARAAVPDLEHVTDDFVHRYV